MIVNSNQIPQCPDPNELGSYRDPRGHLETMCRYASIYFTTGALREAAECARELSRDEHRAALSLVIGHGYDYVQLEPHVDAVSSAVTFIGITDRPPSSDPILPITGPRGSTGERVSCMRAFQYVSRVMGDQFPGLLSYDDVVELNEIEKQRHQAAMKKQYDLQMAMVNTVGVGQLRGGILGQNLESHVLDAATYGISVEKRDKAKDDWANGLLDRMQDVLKSKLGR